MNKDAYKIATESIPMPRPKKEDESKVEGDGSEDARGGPDSAFGSSNSASRLPGGAKGREVLPGSRYAGAGSAMRRGDDGAAGDSRCLPRTKHYGRAGSEPNSGVQKRPSMEPDDDGKSEYEHIPEPLQRSFQTQMAQMADLIGANDRLSEQNEMLKNNRGVKIDHEVRERVVEER